VAERDTTRVDDERAGSITVVIVDDHELFRAGLRELLSENRVEVVGEAASAEEALEVVPEVRPDVVMMDLGLPGMSGAEAIRRLAHVAGDAQVLVLTISPDHDDVTEALGAGACGYLLKDASVGELVAGVRAAAVGEAAISPQVATRLVESLRAESRRADSLREEGRVELSGRELEVLRCVVEGKDNAEVARELYISPQTVKHHISNILAKLGVDNRLQAAVYAVRTKLVE
jgi:DNA-binding NarL/FixJ family response regulator